MVPIFSPPVRRTGVPSTRSLAIKLWDCEAGDWAAWAWLCDISACMVASTSRKRVQHDKAITRDRLPPFRASEQGRHHAHLKWSERNGAVVEPHRKRHGLLAFEHSALAERGHQPGGGVLPGDSAEPGDQLVEGVDRRADLAFRHQALDIEHLEDLLDPHHG